MTLPTNPFSQENWFEEVILTDQHLRAQARLGWRNFRRKELSRLPFWQYLPLRFATSSLVLVIGIWIAVASIGVVAFENFAPEHIRPTRMIQNITQQATPSSNEVNPQTAVLIPTFSAALEECQVGIDLPAGIDGVEYTTSRKQPDLTLVYHPSVTNDILATQTLEFWCSPQLPEWLTGAPQESIPKPEAWFSTMSNLTSIQTFETSLESDLRMVTYVAELGGQYFGVTQYTNSQLQNEKLSIAPFTYVAHSLNALKLSIDTYASRDQITAFEYQEYTYEMASLPPQYAFIVSSKDCYLDLGFPTEPTVTKNPESGLLNVSLQGIEQFSFACGSSIPELTNSVQIESLSEADPNLVSWFQSAFTTPLQKMFAAQNAEFLYAETPETIQLQGQLHGQNLYISIPRARLSQQFDGKIQSRLVFPTSGNTPITLTDGTIEPTNTKPVNSIEKPDQNTLQSAFEQTGVPRFGLVTINDAQYWISPRTTQLVRLQNGELSELGAVPQQTSNGLYAILSANNTEIIIGGCSPSIESCKLESFTKYTLQTQTFEPLSSDSSSIRSIFTPQTNTAEAESQITPLELRLDIGVFTSDNPRYLTILSPQAQLNNLTIPVRTNTTSPMLFWHQFDLQTQTYKEVARQIILRGRDCPGCHRFLRASQTELTLISPSTQSNNFTISVFTQGNLNQPQSQTLSRNEVLEQFTLTPEEFDKIMVPDL